MIYWILSKLFPVHSEYRYVTHPRQIFYGIFVMAIGWVTMIRDHWFTFGLITFLLGIASCIVVLVSIAWEKVTAYWETINEVINTIIKSNNPDLWQVLGMKQPAERITITEVKQADNESGYSMKFHRLPVSPMTMQSIADKVLHSGKADFIEADFSNVPNIRKVRNELKAEGLLSPKNKKNVRLGYTFNKKGLDVLYEYASESIKIELKRRSE